MSIALNPSSQQGRPQSEKFNNLNEKENPIKVVTEENLTLFARICLGARNVAYALFSFGGAFFSNTYRRTWDEVLDGKRFEVINQKDFKDKANQKKWYSTVTPLANLNRSTVADETASQSLWNSAIDNNNLRLARLLIKEKIDINRAYTDGHTPLSIAIEKKSLEIAKDLMHAGAYRRGDVNKPNIAGETPLGFAANNGSREMVEAGADVNGSQSPKQTPLEAAILANNMDMIAPLVTKGADVNKPNIAGVTPLCFAVNNGSTEMVKALIEAGADVNGSQNFGKLLRDATRNGKSEVAAILVKNASFHNKYDAFIEAILSNDVESGKALTVENKSEEELHLLHMAINSEFPEITSLIINKFSLEKSIEKMNQEICSLITHNNLKMVKALIEAKVSLNPENVDKTPLETAISVKSLEMVDFLIKNGANVNLLGDSRTTPLVCAIKEGQKDIVEALINAGADVNGSPGAEETPLETAISVKSLEMVDFLIKNGANVNLLGASRTTPLVCAIKEGQKDIVEALINARADVNGSPGAEETPLEATLRADDRDMFYLLKEKGATIAPPALQKPPSGRPSGELAGLMGKAPSLDNPLAIQKKITGLIKQKDVADKIQQTIKQMIEELGRSGKTQKISKKDEIPYDIKTRYFKGKIQVLFSKYLSQGSFKTVSRIIPLTEERLEGQPEGNAFAYAKIPKLRKLRDTLENRKKDLEIAIAQKEDEFVIEQHSLDVRDARKQCEKVEKSLLKEVEISKIVPDAVKMITVKGIKDPNRTKGIMMQMVTNDYDSFFPIKRDKDSLKNGIQVALCLTQAIGRMHQAGYVHLDLKENNFLVSRSKKSIELKLIDFGLSTKIGESFKQTGCEEFQPPELKKGKSHIADPSMDMWALGHTLEKRLFEGVKNSDIEEVINHLKERNPKDRWSAEKTANRLKEIFDKI